MGAVNGAEMHEICPVCDGRVLKVLWVVNGYTIARCAGCSLVFVQNRVTPEELASHYASGIDEAYDDANRDCLNYYYEKLGSLIQSHVPRPGRILDLGCSKGWFLDVMRGWECYGNEIIPADAEIARARYGNNIVTGSFEDYPLKEEYFDVITLQDVFDHFREPLPALEKTWRMLRPGGLIAIKVHNISCLYARMTGQKFYAIIPPSHLFYYDRETLGTALSRSGFEVLHAGFIGHLMKVKTVFWRLSRGNTSSLAYRAFKSIGDTPLGEMKFHKNLHDIITVLAMKKA
jgi:SAM-dependent methyltransferase